MAEETTAEETVEETVKEKNRGGEPIRVGVSLSLQGKYEETSKNILSSYRMWARQVNRRGGLLGRPVELIVVDDKSKIEKAKEAYRGFFEEPKVDLVLSPYGTPLTLAVSEITEQHGYVLIAAAAAGDQIWDRGYDNVFGMYSTGDRFFIGFLDLCAREGMESVSILYEQNPFNRTAANGAYLWAHRMGIDTVRLFSFRPGGEGIEELWTHVEEANAEALIVSSYPPAGYRSISYLEKSEYTPEAVAMAVTPIDPEFSEKAGEAAEGIFAPTMWEPRKQMPFPGTEKFIEDYREYTGREPTYHAASAFAACRLLEEAIMMTGGIDHEEIREYIVGLDTVTIIGRFKVDHRGKQIGQNPLLIQWQEGEKEIVYPRSMRTSEPRFGDGK